jgi:glycosyltransferase involved in cell wall biosynthesis
MTNSLKDKIDSNPVISTHLGGMNEDPEMTPLVVILLGTYNGERFLSQQLNSLEAQTHPNWVLIASDDGSNDTTLDILLKYQAKLPQGKMTIRKGPRKGFCHNFLSLACDSQIKADYYAFCDQDDVWLPTKLAVALNNIQKHQKNGEGYVYCGRTTYVNENLQVVGSSPLFSYPRNFRNALIQSIAGGNTMVFNQTAKEYLEKAGTLNHPTHDWWVYQLVTGVGGTVFYDPQPQVLYRQHQEALVGGNSSFMAGLERVWRLFFKDQLKIWGDMNIAALSSVKPMLNQSNQETLDLYAKMRNSNLGDRLRLLEVAGLYRQTWPGTISLILASLFKKI